MITSDEELRIKFRSFINCLSTKDKCEFLRDAVAFSRSADNAKLLLDDRLPTIDLSNKEDGITTLNKIDNALYRYFKIITGNFTVKRTCVLRAEKNNFWFHSPLFIATKVVLESRYDYIYRHTNDMEDIENLIDYMDREYSISNNELGFKRLSKELNKLTN